MPSATCLYSAGSMWPRLLSAAVHSFSSKPTVAPLDFLAFAKGPLRFVTSLGSVGEDGT